MKKTFRKLTLSRETLRNLETPNLHQIVGAKRTETPTCQTQCDCTFSCPANCPSAATFC